MNLPHLLFQNWTLRNVLDLYNYVKDFFAFPYLNKKRCLYKIAWNTYYNILCARNGYLVGEQVPNNQLKENVSYQKTIFSCIIIVVSIFLLSLKQKITALPAMVYFSLSPIFWDVS